MIRAHKIKLNPNAAHREYFAKAAGTRRFVFNWGLDEWQKQREAGEKPSALKLKKQFQAIRREEFPWTLDVTKTVIEGAFMDLGDAFQRFFNGQNGYPQFKRKHARRESFYLANDKFKVVDHFIQIPKLGWVNMAEKLRFSGKILKATITQDKVGDWYAAIAVEVQEQTPQTIGEAVGIDLGLLRLVTLSNGQGFENQKPLAQYEHQLAQLQRSLSRKTVGSRRWEKARVRVAKLHRRIACIRMDHLHKITTELATHYSFIGVENLHVKGMMCNHKLAKALGDASLGALHALLVSKCTAYGVTLQPVDRFFPSSQLCSNCGARKDDLSLGERTYCCNHCGLEIDRDWNAAINIRDEALCLAGKA